jgi:hypothetical protein
MNMLIFILINLVLIAIPVGAIFLAFRLKKQELKRRQQADLEYIKWGIDLQKQFPGSPPLPATKRALEKVEDLKTFVMPIEQKILELCQINTGVLKGQIFFQSKKWTADGSGYFLANDNPKKHHFNFKKGTLQGDELVQSLGEVINEIRMLMEERDKQMYDIVLKYRQS